MSQPFLTSMKDTLLEEHNLSRTENGAFGYRTTGKELLDLNFAVVLPPAGDASGNTKIGFWKAYYEAPVLAVKWLFFARDIRGGMGSGGCSGYFSLLWHVTNRRWFGPCCPWFQNTADGTTCGPCWEHPCIKTY